MLDCLVAGCEVSCVRVYIARLPPFLGLNLELGDGQNHSLLYKTFHRDHFRLLKFMLRSSYLKRAQQKLSRNYRHVRHIKPSWLVLARNFLDPLFSRPPNMGGKDVTQSF